MNKLILSFLASYFTFVFSKYNCNNEGPDGCLNGAKCNYFGRCECPPGYHGYNCGLQLAQRSLGPGCHTECLHGGTCYNGNMCYCTEDYFGDFCQYAMEYIRCGIEGMEITVKTSSKFNGIVSTKPNATDCPFEEYSSGNYTSLRSFKLLTPLSLLHSNPCSGAINRTVTAENVTYTIDVVISQDKEVYNPLKDRILKFTCNYPRKIGTALTTDITQTYTPVELIYLDGNKQPLSHGVQEGDVFFIDFSPTKESGKTGLQVISLEAFSVHDGKVTTFKMVQKGCIVTAAENRVKSLATVEGLRDGEVIYKTRIEMRAFSLHGNSYLHFNYDLKYCDGPCTPIVCSKPIISRPPVRKNRFGPGLNIVI